MHPSMIELFEQLRQGLLWVGSDAVVRHANHTAVRTMGLLVGRRIEHHELARAVVATAVDGSERQVRLPLATRAAGDGGADLDCRVLPGLGGDDAFVLLGRADQPDGTEGLDTLMRAIGRELHDPLRAAHAALDLAGAADGSADALELQLLFDRVDDVLRVADRLADLATLWNGGTLAADDRIELWPLLQQVWADVEPLALERQVRVRFTSDTQHRELATLYGSERWMRRLLIECLQGAVRLAPAGASIEVEHQQNGPRACIVLRDCALFRGGAAGRDAIAHKLCRHVLALHGGRLREELEGDSRHLVLELPTGAPNRGDDPELAIAQAQRYARDLAALMGRRRGGAHAEPAAAAT